MLTFSEKSPSHHRVICSTPALFKALTAGLLTIALSGCMTAGPDYRPQQPQSPAAWSSWHSGSHEMAAQSGMTTDSDAALPPQWWTVFGDPVLDRLQEQAAQASPDLRTAALRFAQSREQRHTVAAQRGPQVDLSGGVSRQRQSEYGAMTRMAQNNDDLVRLLGEPFTLYQAGFDMSWELDLWGRIRRSIEAADADVSAAAALLDSARLSIASEVARNYFEWHSIRRQLRVVEQDIDTTGQSLKLVQARTDGGLADQLDVVRQRAILEELRARLPQLQEQETHTINQIALLLGTRPGALQDELNNALTNQPDAAARAGGDMLAPLALPDLTLGLPSQVARRRPDIRAAEAQLHAATASIGVAVADLYPSITLGAGFGYESTSEGKFGDWGSRTWSIGPTLRLPIFDQGRRRAVINLRQLQQQETAVAYQQTILRAWQEIDDALSAYHAETVRNRELRDREQSSRQAYELAKARYRGGLTDFLTELDAQRTLLQARRDLVDSNGQLRVRLVAVYKAVGGGDISVDGKGEN